MSKTPLNLDFRSHPEQRSLFPRFLRNPAQTPHTPSAPISLAFLIIVSAVFSVTILLATSRDVKHKFSLRLVPLIGVFVALVGNFIDYFTGDYSFARNSAWCGAALACGLIGFVI